MAARSTWRGAIEFAGFPVNVAIFPLTKSRQGESFKLLTPDGKPVEQFYREAGSQNGELYKIGELGRGVEVGDGEIRPIPEAALEQISEAERSSVLEASYFAPVESVPMDLAVSTYSVMPDSKVAGSTKSVNLIWNGLRDRSLAYVTKVTFRSGSPDQILVIYAAKGGLAAITLPFAEDLHPEQPVLVEPDEAQAELFSRFVSQSDVKVFSLDDFTSDSRELRRKAVEAALEGKPMPVKERKEPEIKDLVAALEAQLAATA